MVDQYEPTLFTLTPFSVIIISKDKEDE
jgi:hypothetical protein